MRINVVNVILGGLVLAGAVFVLTHLGAYPEIQQTAAFRVLAAFVTLNTLIFAMLAAVKMGYQSGRKQKLAQQAADRA